MTLDLSETIHKLQSYNDSSFPILSVYLPLHAEKIPISDFKRLIYGSLEENDLVRFARDILYMEGFLEVFENKHSYQGIAMFSSHSNMWEVITTPFAMRPAIVINHSPYLSPIKQQLEEYHRYLFVLADRKKTRLFTLFLGHIEQEEYFEDDSVPQKTKGRGLSEREDKKARHIQDHLHRHFNYVAQKTKEFVGQKPITGVIIGGHKELLRNLRDHLPQPLQKKIMAEFIADPGSSVNTLLTKSKDIIQQVKTGLAMQKTPHYLLGV